MQERRYRTRADTSDSLFSGSRNANGGRRVAAQKSMGHRDKERAKADAFTVLSALKSRQEALKDGRLTLAMPFDKYEGSPALCGKKGTTQREDRRKLERFIGFAGAERDIMTLSPSRRSELRGSPHARADQTAISSAGRRRVRARSPADPRKLGYGVRT